MTAHILPSRRLLLSSIAALMVLAGFLTVYARSAQQVRTLDREMARIQPQRVDGDSGAMMKRSRGADTQAYRHLLRVGL